METKLKRTLYLYDNVFSGYNCSVLRTSLPIEEEPGYSTVGCGEFTDLEWSLIKWSFTEEELSSYFRNGFKPPLGWTRMTPWQREKFLIACAAHGVHLQIIQWEGEK